MWIKKKNIIKIILEAKKKKRFIIIHVLPSIHNSSTTTTTTTKCWIRQRHGERYKHIMIHIERNWGSSSFYRTFEMVLRDLRYLWRILTELCMKRTRILLENIWKLIVTNLYLCGFLWKFLKTLGSNHIEINKTFWIRSFCSFQEV